MCLIHTTMVQAWLGVSDTYSMVQAWLSVLDVCVRVQAWLGLSDTYSHGPGMARFV